MRRLLLMEGNTREARERGSRMGVESPGEIYRRALLAERPDLEIDVLFGADPEMAIPSADDWRGYDGFVISGSSLHAYDREPAVTRQIEIVRLAADTGIPIFGSCWGLQIAAMAGGGMVARNLSRAEMGIARKIAPTAEGRAHPLLSGRPAAFDAPCIHYDDVTRLPEGSVVLAANSHCPVQAATIPLGRSVVWAVQYHPEFDLPHILGLYRLYGTSLVGTAFFESEQAWREYVTELEAVVGQGPDSPLAWRLGIDGDILDDSTRRSELRNWLEHAVGAELLENHANG